MFCINEKGQTLQTAIFGFSLTLLAAASIIIAYAITTAESGGSENSISAQQSSDDAETSSVILAGAHSSCIISNGYDAETGIAEGSVKCWGNAEYMQLGNNAPAPLGYYYKASRLITHDGQKYANIGGFSLNSEARICRGLQDPLNDDIFLDDLNDDIFPLPTEDVACIKFGNRISTSNEYYSAGTVIGIKDMALGDNHACVITAADTIRCWGKNDKGQASPTNKNQIIALSPFSYDNEISLPARRGYAQRPIAIYAGKENSCVITTLERIYCWGSGESGQLGEYYSKVLDSDYTGPQAPLSNPVEIAIENRGAETQASDMAIGDRISLEKVSFSRTLEALVSDMAIGDSHICAIISDYNNNPGAEVYCLGSNRYNQLALASTESSESFIKVEGLFGALEISAGAYHTCAITSTRGLSCWGMVTDDYGLGQAVQNEESEESAFRLVPTPEEITGITGVTAIVASGHNTCVLTPTLKCWGDLKLPSRFTAEPVGLALGNEHICVLMPDDEELRCLGDNSRGQLALPSLPYFKGISGAIERSDVFVAAKKES